MGDVQVTAGKNSKFPSVPTGGDNNQPGPWRDGVDAAAIQLDNFVEMPQEVPPPLAVVPIVPPSAVPLTSYTVTGSIRHKDGLFAETISAEAINQIEETTQIEAELASHGIDLSDLPLGVVPREGLSPELNMIFCDILSFITDPEAVGNLDIDWDIPGLSPAMDHFASSTVEDGAAGIGYLSSAIIYGHDWWVNYALNFIGKDFKGFIETDLEQKLMRSLYLPTPKEWGKTVETNLQYDLGPYYADVVGSFNQEGQFWLESFGVSYGLTAGAYVLGNAYRANTANQAWPPEIAQMRPVMGLSQVRSALVANRQAWQRYQNYAIIIFASISHITGRLNNVIESLDPENKVAPAVKRVIDYTLYAAILYHALKRLVVSYRQVQGTQPGVEGRPVPLPLSLAMGAAYFGLIFYSPNAATQEVVLTDPFHNEEEDVFYQPWKHDPEHYQINQHRAQGITQYLWTPFWASFSGFSGRIFSLAGNALRRSSFVEAQAVGNFMHPDSLQMRPNETAFVNRAGNRVSRVARRVALEVAPRRLAYNFMDTALIGTPIYLMIANLSQGAVDTATADQRRKGAAAAAISILMHNASRGFFLASKGFFTGWDAWMANMFLMNPLASFCGQEEEARFQSAKELVSEIKLGKKEMMNELFKLYLVSHDTGLKDPAKNERLRVGNYIEEQLGVPIKRMAELYHRLSELKTIKEEK